VVQARKNAKKSTTGPAAVTTLLSQTNRRHPEVSRLPVERLGDFLEQVLRHLTRVADSSPKLVVAE
jgi:predicted lysophospholipase L1 biosynthesis ABC-type transport system permease subunit